MPIDEATHGRVHTRLHRVGAEDRAAPELRDLGVKQLQGTGQLLDGWRRIQVVLELRVQQLPKALLVKSDCGTNENRDARKDRIALGGL